MTIWQITRALAVVAPVVFGGCSSLMSEFRLNPGTGQEVAGTPYERGKYHYAAGQFGLAVKHFQTAVNYQPESIEALNGLAAAYDRLARYDLSARYYGRALTLNPESAQTLNNMGYSYLLQKRFDLAVAYLRDAYDLDRNNPVVAGNWRSAEAGVQYAGPPRRARDKIARIPGTEPGAVAPGTEPVAVAPKTEPGAAGPVPLIVRTAPEVQTLVTRPQLAFITDVTDVRVSPRWSTYRVRQPEAGDLMPHLIAAPMSGIWPRKPAKTGDARDAGPAGRGVADRGGDPPVPLAKPVTAPLIEVSNGTGRLRMAARLRNYLEGKGITAGRLTNADHYSHMETTIYYREVWRQYAVDLANALPAEVDLESTDDQAADIRIELGGDLLDFDAELFYAARRSPSARSG
ncbi:MAG: LytR C-terminal domain-containing protein [Kiloniellaceae bacterium]